jgi:hypothetical protein
MVAWASVAPAQKVPSKTHLCGRASGLVHLFGTASPGQTKELALIGSDGTSRGLLVLPEKTAFVVTDLTVSVNGTPSAGITRGGIVNTGSGGASGPTFSFDATQQGMQTVHLTSGVVWTVRPGVVNAVDSKNGVFVNVYGYLVKNR